MSEAICGNSFKIVDLLIFVPEKIVDKCTSAGFPQNLWFCVTLLVSKLQGQGDKFQNLIEHNC